MNDTGQQKVRRSFRSPALSVRAEPVHGPADGIFQVALGIRPNLDKLHNNSAKESGAT